MSLAPLDWIFILWYFFIVLTIGIFYSKQASGSISDYFISRRSLPWWIVGTSMVATTFAADTPLAVAGIVGKNGIAGNWLWWNFVFGGMLTVFLFARLWRRSEVITDVEFTELRYDGKPAAILRGFRALYLGIPINCIIMGWVILAMAKILEVTMAFHKWQAIIILLIIAVFYSVLSGFWGVVTTDFLQFGIAMAGSIILAIIAVDHIGGISVLKLRLTSSGYGNFLNFFPDIGSPIMPLLVFFIYIAVQWWSTWYPGAEPGGGGYVAQRMFSAKDEKHSLFATLWFNIAHYALRPWPWILVALVSLLVYPNLADKEIGYPKMMVDFLPVGLKGLMIAAFFAAFMSTIDTHLNWGASYIVNDFYKRFIKKDAEDRHYVLISRVTVILLMGLAGFTAYSMETIKGAWELLLAIGAGTGLVYILRWYWWRINAWSEISSMISSFVVAVFLLKFTVLGKEGEINWAYRMFITVGITTIIWIIVTLLTKVVSKEHLKAFYKKVRPAGLWKPIREEVEEEEGKPSLILDIINWILGCILIYSALFGIGKLILGEIKIASLLIIISLVTSYLIYQNIKKYGFKV